MGGRLGCLRAAVLALATGACQASAPAFRVHHLWLEGEVAAPERVLVLPAEVAISRMGMNGIEPVPELSRRASADMEATLATMLPGRGLELVPMPSLTEEQRAAVEEHMLMFEAASGATFPMPAGVPFGSQDGKLWWPKVERFDLELGPGLSFLAQSTGCSTGVFLAGIATEPTGGRQAWSVFGSMVGVYEQISLTGLYLGFVDLVSGAILWTGMHVEKGDWLDRAGRLTDHDELAEILADILARYPGLDEYRAAVKQE